MLRALLDESARRACRRALVRRLQLALFSAAALLGFAMAATGPTAYITDWPGYVQQPRVQTEARTADKRQGQGRASARPPRPVLARRRPPPAPPRLRLARARVAPPVRPVPAPPRSPIVVRGPPSLLA